MIFKGLYEEKPRKEEKEWYLRVDVTPEEREPFGCVAVDKDGSVISFLFSINKKGELSRNVQVSENLGFALDCRGRIKVKE